ncbi:tRNA guanosine(34) transglycosylase Tgt [Candidatus Falkowbacteria bacterium]|jgi:queuine tRNA-ribosyltransferase|nr:tRNA guanosine(34) transglycosylase Tgt [Candidatus Falkowbacteria bacterium]
MFKLIKTTKSGIRRGVLQTAHGVLNTPFYMPDATRGFVKLMTNDEVKSTGTAVLVVNTFHLYLQPGLAVIKKAGGLHRFMNWSGPLLADSGGFQVFSLLYKNKQWGEIRDDKVIFKSPLDGSRHELSPEKSIQIQFALGVDMMVCLDDCPPNESSRAEIEKAVKRTIAWAKRCKAEYLKQIKKRKLTGVKKPLLFAVIQGGAEIDLREKCAQELVRIGFDGYGFGARPIDQEGNFLAEVLAKTASFIPEKAVRFALGIGTPADIKRCAEMGWDIFDCVIPTREGRHGKLFIAEKNDKYTSININNACFATDFSAINKNSKLKELKTNSRAYLHHLFKLNELLGQKIASLNNLEFYQNVLAKLRRS